jgi:DNA-binding NarL/FixJ family response regulator
VTIRILVAEDSLLVREGIGRMIDRHDDMALMGAYGDLPSLLEAAEEHRPDVIVTDIRMPPSHTDEGIRAAIELRARRPEIGVVVVSQYASRSYVVRLLEGGASRRGYLLKERLSEVDQLPIAVRTVAMGGSVIDPVVVDALMGAQHGGGRSELMFLSDREREVLGEMAQGKSNAAIASSLYLGERAVEKHINSILSKLGLLEDRDMNRRVKAVLLYLAEQEHT